MASSTDERSSLTSRLTLRDITVKFGGLTALDSVSLDVPAGKVVGLMGPNGAGKTTLFNVVCGVYTPTSGSIALNGSAFQPKPHKLLRNGVSRTLQGLGLFSGLNVVNNVVTGLSHKSHHNFFDGLLALPRATRDEDDKHQRALIALRRLNIEQYANAYPDTLPYAIRKKVALARALVSEPSLLLLDEPAGGLGHEEIDELIEIIREVPRSGCSVLLVEHHVDLVMSVSDRIAVLDFGKRIAEGTPEEIRTNDDVSEAYLGADVA